MEIEGNRPVWTTLMVSLLFCGALFSTAQSVRTQETSAQCSNNSSNSSLSWQHYQDSCYSAYTDSTFSYEDGKEFCKRNGASLVSIHSMSEMRFIVTLVGRNTGRFWTGLHKSYPLEYQWEDGTSVDYVNWRLPGEDLYYVDPDDDPVSLDICATFTPPDVFWDRNSCDFLSHVICKYRSSGIPSTTTTAPIGFCPEGWYTFGDNCYKIGGKQFSERKGWFDASSQCEAIGSQLLSIHSAREQDFLNTLMLEVRTRIWIGLSRSSSNAEFTWKDDSPIDYSNWSEGEPNNHLNTEENCVQLLERPGALGEWNDAPCRLKFPYICKKPRDPTITQESLDPSLCTEPEGWLKIKNSCYKVFNEVQSPASWLQAQRVCANSSAILVAVKNFQVTAELRIHMKEMDGYFWIGMYSAANQRYTWIGGVPVIYSNWKSDQPIDVSDENNCVAMNPEGEWMVRNCNESLPFICQVNEASSEGPPTSPPSSNMSCPESSPKWHDLGQKYCYIFEVKEKFKWYEAACLCTKEGGHLASFHSTEEVNLLVHYLEDLGVPLHIGLERDRRGRFVWSDGSPTDFDNWNRGQPSSEREQCVAMATDTGKWNDIHCSERHGYICSVPKVQLIANSPPPSSGARTYGVHSSATTAIAIISTLALLVIAAVALYCYYPSLMEKVRGRNPFAKLESEK